MAIKILLPKVSFVVTEGKIIEWLKKTGDPVSKGEPLLVVETEKAAIEIESPGSGFLGSELAPVGTVVPVTTTIGYIVAEGEQSPKLVLPSEQPTITTSTKDHPEANQGKTTEDKWMKVSPLARRTAKELGVDLTKINGTGPNGRILQEDILAFAAGQDQVSLSDSSSVGSALPSQAVTHDPVEIHEISTLQRITAERMTMSFGTAPHFYLNVQVDMSQAFVMREAYLLEGKEKAGVRLSFTDILIFAASRALEDHPALNAKFENDKHYRFQNVNICLAIDTPLGLIAPVFHQADRLSIIEIHHRRVDLVERAQNNQLAPEDLVNGTFTISNLGMFGIDSFHAIVNPPQAAILAIGQIAKRPVVVNDILEVRPILKLSLSVDHRVADGAVAARFLKTLTVILENPYKTLMRQD